MIDASFVSAIQGLAQTAAAAKVYVIDGHQYVEQNGKITRLDPPAQSWPSPFKVHTLTGLAEYIDRNRDELNFANCVLHVEGPETVRLASKVTGEEFRRTRFLYVEAENWDRFAALKFFEFGRYFDVETFIIALQALFEASSVKSELLGILGNLSDDEVVNTLDDGMSQQTVVKAGITRVGNATLPNPITLAPYRTFPEVAQPESPFILRLKKGAASGKLGVALFEADGGAWKNSAIESVATWLSENVPDNLAIIA